MKKHWFKILSWIILFQLIGIFLGLLTKNNINPWYNTLNKPNLTPPSIVFSIVWPILYLLLAISGYILWQKRRNPQIQPALYCFIMQILMNWAWTPIFFHLHWIGFSFFWISTITLLTLATIFLINTKIKSITLMLTPYLLWLLFATYLNASIWLLN